LRAASTADLSADVAFVGSALIIAATSLAFFFNSLILSSAALRALTSDAETSFF
jgi:hypothetical protein